MRAQLLLHFIIYSLLLLDNLCYFFGLFPLFLTFPVCFASCNCCGFCGKFVREWLKGSEKKKTNAHCLQRKPQLYCIQICISNKFFFV